MSKEELIAAIQQHARKLGRTPTLRDFLAHAKMRDPQFREHFSSWHAAAEAAGIDLPMQMRVDIDALFMEWSRIVRNFGRVPGRQYLLAQCRYSDRPFMRWFRKWSLVAAGMREHIVRRGLQQEYSDVLRIIDRHLKLPPENEEARSTSATKPRVRKDRPVYGAALTELPLAHAPVNEFGVVFLFGKLARELGFVALRIRAEFPDIEAMREVGENQWQHTWVEVEYESRNFLRHGHNAKKCGVIVCWIHNWPGCPLEVIELREVLRKRMEARQMAR